MRRLLAALANGTLSRRDFTRRMLGLGFATGTVESILDVVPEVSAAQARERFRVEPFKDRTPYEQWAASEDIPVHTGYQVVDVRKVEVRPWSRVGASGALIDLEGAEGTDGAYVLQIDAGASTLPQRYLFEETLYVLDGEGETAVWQEGGRKQTFRWQKRSLFSPPLNTWRQHFNRGRTPARLVAVTDLPVIMDLFHNPEFIFGNRFDFRDRYSGEPAYFTLDDSKVRSTATSAMFTEGEKGEAGVLDTGLVPDVSQIRLYEARSRGLKNKSAEVVLSDNTMQSHLSEFEVGTYKLAHRHGPGSHVLVLGGTGYSLMWTDAPKYSEARKKVRVDWQDGTLFVPPDRWFHQHFNVGETSAKYMATTWIGGKYFSKALGGGGRTHRLNTVHVRDGGNMVANDIEDDVIRDIFEDELRKRGVTSRMPPRK